MEQDQVTDGRFWTQTRGVVTWRWCGEVWSTECILFLLQHHGESEKQICGCKLTKHKGFCSWLGRRSGQPSSRHTAGQGLAKADTESLVLSLAVLLAHKMDFVSFPHPPRGDGDHPCLFCRAVLPSLHVCYGIRGCMKYGHHFITFNMVSSWGNTSVNMYYILKALWHREYIIPISTMKVCYGKHCQHYYCEGCLTFPSNMCVNLRFSMMYINIFALKLLCWCKVALIPMQGAWKLWKWKILGRSCNFSSTPTCVWLHDTVF